ncbi:hypothetical protein MTO96_034695 [Rhipicephalus appendiculatus]
MPTTDNALSAAKMVEPVPVVTQTPAFVVTNASTVASESESRITASALQSAALAAIPTGSAPGLAIVNAESPEESVLKSGVPLVPHRFAHHYFGRRPSDRNGLRSVPRKRRRCVTPPKAAGPPLVPTGNLLRPHVPAPS